MDHNFLTISCKPFFYCKQYLTSILHKGNIAKNYATSTFDNPTTHDTFTTTTTTSTSDNPTASDFTITSCNLIICNTAITFYLLEI